MRHKQIILPFGLLSAIAIYWSSCKFDSLEELEDSICDTSYVASYQNDVVPILTAECYECHDATFYIYLGGGNLLEGYSNLVNYVNDSRLLCAIKHSGCAVPMPYGRGKLPDSDIAKIKTWVCQEALNN